MKRENKGKQRKRHEYRANKCIFHAAPTKRNVRQDVWRSQDTVGHRDNDRERDGSGHGAEDRDNQVLSSGECGVSAVARQFLIEFTLRMRRHCDSGRGGMQHERYECGQNGDECHSPAHSENNWQLQAGVAYYTHAFTHTVCCTHTHKDSLVSELSWKWLALRFLRLRCAYSSQRDLTWLNHDIEEDNDNVCWWSSTDGGNNYVDVDYLLPGCCTPQRFLIKLMKCILWLLATAQPENNQHSHDDDSLIQTIEWRFMGSLKIASICSFLIPQPFRVEFLYKLQ